ncbi:hypothetical protein [Acidihalobacter ferrooxydans]|uniref:Uncharacterized protein n=1 Tax=Acidihalobacter ferrooxydans TaxID=1765967 RepID=A0A1P8UFE2_9GAMM|nr:hypothetical protein [Acidihalobacter ferrooxydans]APZ42511.1 hypothetical protein BW247_04910 [Acidihalobacter ferrooxydans]
MSIITDIAEALGSAKITGSKTRKTSERVEHFWSIQGGRTAYLVEVRKRFVSWQLIDKPLGVVWTQSRQDEAEQKTD